MHQPATKPPSNNDVGGRSTRRHCLLAACATSRPLLLLMMATSSAVQVALWSSKGLPPNLPPDVLRTAIPSETAAAASLPLVASVPDLLPLLPTLQHYHKLQHEQQGGGGSGGLVHLAGVSHLVSDLWLMLEDQGNLEALPFGNDGVTFDTLSGRKKVPPLRRRRRRSLAHSLEPL